MGPSESTTPLASPDRQHHRTYVTGRDQAKLVAAQKLRNARIITLL